MQLAQDAPAITEHLIVDVVSGKDGQRPMCRLEDEHRIAAIREAGRDDGQDWYATSLGEERHERLVLDLLESSVADMPGAISLPQRRPDGGSELAIPGVSPVDLQEQRLTMGVCPQYEGYPLVLKRSVRQIGGLDPKVFKGRRDLIEGQSPARGPKEKMRDLGRDQSDQEGGNDPDG